MKITEQAKALLLETLKKENFTCYLAGIHYGCCSEDSMIQFGLGNIEDGDQVYYFEGIPFVMEEDTLKRSELVSIYVENGELMYMDESLYENDSECSCGHDHEGHDHEEDHECACGHNHEGHHHHHEGDHECACGHSHEAHEENCTCGEHEADEPCTCGK